MTPQITQSQAVEMFKKQKRQLARRLEVTKVGIDVLQKVAEVYGNPNGEALAPVGIIAFSILNVNLSQLNLAKTEGDEQMAELDEAIRRAESPIHLHGSRSM